MRAAQALVLILVAATSVSAQATKTPTRPDSSKGAATKSPATKTDAKAVAPGAKADTKAAAPQAAGTKTNTKQAPNQAAGTKQAATPAGTKQAATPPAQAPAQITPPMIMRETFAYRQESRRDPFFSLLNSAELRPTVSDLRLTGILFDEGGRNSVATMRDLTTDAMYRVRTGQIIGRMRVALIKRTVVIFSIEEFGENRQDSLVLGDTTKARAK